MDRNDKPRAQRRKFNALVGIFMFIVGIPFAWWIAHFAFGWKNGIILVAISYHVIFSLLALFIWLAVFSDSNVPHELRENGE